MNRNDDCCRDLKYLRELLQLRIRVLVGDGKITPPPHTRVRLEVLRSVVEELNVLLEKRM
jgi:hypothetical protein